MHRFTFKLSYFYFFFLLLIFTLAFYNIFYGLKNFPISSWDEARHGVSAYEMLRKGNYIVNTYRNHIDYWNLKPPLSFWANMVGYKIAGFNSLGLRLISAVSAMLTIITVAVFVYYKHGKLASLLSTLSMATSTQFLINHSARTGDADSLFVFLFTLSILSLLLSNDHLNWLYLSGFFFSLAFLTKSWHAGNIILVMILYLLISRSYKKLNGKHWLLLIVSMSAPILVWAGIRCHYDGIKFFKNMISYDLLKRSSNSIEGHIGDGLYYIKILWGFFDYWLVLLCGTLLIYLSRDISLKAFKSGEKKYLMGLCLWIVIPLILFSIAKTKIRWYILPVYPPLSIIIGVLTSQLMLQAKFITRIALLALIFFAAIHYEGEINHYLKNPPSKLQLNLIQKIHDIKGFKGYTLFLHQPLNSAKWTQNMVLTSELYNDSQVGDGDINAFLKTDKALLLLKKGRGAKQVIESNHLFVIASNQWGYIVGKNKYCPNCTVEKH